MLYSGKVDFHQRHSEAIVYELQNANCFMKSIKRN